MDIGINNDTAGIKKDVRLVVEIQNKQPLELLDLTKSFIALANQFNNFASESGDSIENREAKLFVKEIRTGSVIMELVEFATIGVLPFAENMNTIIGFAGYVKNAYDYVLGKSPDKPKELTKSDYKDLSQIINPIANDNASQLNISAKVNGDVHLTFNIGSLEANAVQNLIEKATTDLKRQEDGAEAKKKVLLTFYQTRSDVNAKAGNKGIVEELSKLPVNIIFEDPALNQEMLHGEFNPNETVYVVDVLPQTVNGKVAAYKILKLHETFNKPE